MIIFSIEIRIMRPFFLLKRCLFACMFGGITNVALSQDIKCVLNHYDGTDCIKHDVFPLKNGKVKDSNGNSWIVCIDSIELDKSIGKMDYKVVYRLADGSANNISWGINSMFSNWSGNNFVLIPAIVYDGNRFEKKVMNYPPYWYDKNEWKIDMPTTTPLVPSLEKNHTKGSININTGNAATPLMAFYSPGQKKAWIIQTCQGNEYGNYGFTVNEDKFNRKAEFIVSSPAVRKYRSDIAGNVDSGDMPANLSVGDSIVINFRTYSIKAENLHDMYNLFFDVRKDMNKYNTDYAFMPFSEVWKTMNNTFRENRWNEDIEMFCLSKPGTLETWNQIWQLGWVGGGQATLPLIMSGDETNIKNAIRNLDVIFNKTQCASGFFNAFGNGYEFRSFGFGEAFKYNETFVRSQGDFLYMVQKQIDHLKLVNVEIPHKWLDGIKRQADAFVKLWDAYGQVGQFVDVETGDLCIGGSTSGAIVPGGLALAYKTFNCRKYLEVAQQLAEKFYNDFVLKGYTTGGPAEILSSPDSESAYALLESFMTLYEVTSDRKWIEYSRNVIPIFASWVVSYDFDFPENSTLGKLGVHSTGSVWANVPNKHSAPAICTWGGESLLKYFRATNDYRVMELLRDISHGVPQYMSHKDRKVGNMEPGGCCERVNLSDWEGKENIGGNIFGSCSWVETATMLTVTQLPSIYVQKDMRYVEIFDHLKLLKKEEVDGKLRLVISNPTNYDAKVKIYVENTEEMKNDDYKITDKNKLKIIEIKKRSVSNVDL